MSEYLLLWFKEINYSLSISSFLALECYSLIIVPYYITMQLGVIPVLGSSRTMVAPPGKVSDCDFKRYLDLLFKKAFYQICTTMCNLFCKVKGLMSF